MIGARMPTDGKTMKTPGILLGFCLLALAGCIDRGLGKACLEVDLFGIGRGCGGHRCGALLEGGAAIEQLLAAFIRDAKAGFLDVHV